MDEVGRLYRLRILLVLVDDENNLNALTELNKIAFINNFTLIYTWSNQESARYLETWKNYENKAPTIIQSKEETEYLPRMNKVLTNIRSINKTDVSTLLDVFGNLAGICQASEEQLILCPGLGEKKVKRLYKALHEPFEKRHRTRDINNPQEQIMKSTTTSSRIETGKIVSEYEQPDWQATNSTIIYDFKQQAANEKEIQRNASSKSIAEETIIDIAGIKPEEKKKQHVDDVDDDVIRLSD
jgi:NAD-dependent DNA ligase